MKQINYIHRIEVAAAKDLQISGSWGEYVYLPKTISWLEIPITGLATLSIESTKEDKSLLYNTSMSFIPDLEHYEKTERAVYRLTTIGGQKILVGDIARPYVVTEVTTEHPDSLGSPCRTTAKVTWNSPVPPRYIR